MSEDDDDRKERIFKLGPLELWGRRRSEDDETRQAFEELGEALREFKRALLEVMGLGDDGTGSGVDEAMMAAWLPVEPGSELKRCPRCGDATLEGFTECTECGAAPEDDQTWRRIASRWAQYARDTNDGGDDG